MKTEVHFNSPIKNCRTWAHFQTDRNLGDEWGSCLKAGGWSAKLVIANPELCGPASKWWQAAPPVAPDPPHRSLRQWLYDTFWKIEPNDIP